MRGRRVAALCAALLTAATVALPVPGGAEPAQAAVAERAEEPVRILVVGDSVTQGSAGDWTWRYRLWRHLTAAGVAVDLVGPRDDLYDNVSGQQGSHAYADPSFDRDHAARWGMQVEVLDVPIADLVTAYEPDVVVEMLGVNDIIFGNRSGDAVAGRVARLVEEARSADPGVALVLAEATQTWWAGVPQLNEALAGVAADVSTPSSPVVLAETSRAYEAGPDTWDGSHPNARGEAKIAAAVADALAALGVGPEAADPVALPPVGPRWAASLTGAAGVGSATLSWSGPAGATSQYVWLRDVTARTPWQRLPYPVEGRTWTAGLLDDGHRYAFRLQPRKGDDEPEGAVYSNVVEVVPGVPPAAPRRLVAKRSRGGVVAAWRPVAGATRYQVEVRGAAGWRTAAFTARTSYVVRGSAAGRPWRIRIRSWDEALAGGATTVRLAPERP